MTPLIEMGVVKRFRCDDGQWEYLPVSPKEMSDLAERIGCGLTAGELHKLHGHVDEILTFIGKAMAHVEEAGADYLKGRWREQRPRYSGRDPGPPQGRSRHAISNSPSTYGCGTRLGTTCSWTPSPTTTPALAEDEDSEAEAECEVARSSFEGPNRPDELRRQFNRAAAR